MYTTHNFKTKKAFKAAVLAGEKVSFFQPGPFGGNESKNGTVFIEGPYYPAAHTWYAECQAKDGYIVKVK